MSLSEYQYETLRSPRSIRVFLLEPAWWTDSLITGTLVEVNLGDNPSFEALSYVWGSATSKNPINVHGSVLQVTPNCLDALRSLRHRFLRRALWIDAICIDQTSQTEKNHQVPLMAEIYSKAITVLVWLNDSGTVYGRARETMSLIKWIGWMYRWWLIRVYEEHQEVQGRIPKNTLLVRTCERWITRRAKDLGDAFIAPFTHSYFARVWTVQEIVMARSIRVYHGNAVVLWPDFVAAALFAVKEPGGFLKFQEKKIQIDTDGVKQWSLINGLETHFALLDSFGLEAIYQGRNTSVLQTVSKGVVYLALSKSRALNATVPKDKAYAMLWAFEEDIETNRALRQVDYTKPIEIIYFEFTIAMLKKLKAPTDIFYDINTENRNPNLPSWVPDWQSSAPMTHFLWTQTLRSSRAAGQASLRYHLSFDGIRLQIRGKKVETIKALIALSQEMRHQTASLNTSERWVESMLDIAAILKGFVDTFQTVAGPTTEDELIDIIGTMVRNHMEIHHLTPFEEDICERQGTTPIRLRILTFLKLFFMMDTLAIDWEAVSIALQTLLPNSIVTTVLERAASLTHLTPFLALVMGLDGYISLYQFLAVASDEHHDKDFFITETGKPGIAFHGLKAKDHIVLWEGCCSPMIVQRLDVDGEVLWRVRGPAQVVGLMEGEAWGEDNELDAFVVV